MGKSKKKQPKFSGPPKPQKKLDLNSDVPEALRPKALNPEEQKAATERLIKLFKTLAAPPESLYHLFNRIGLDYEIVAIVPGDPTYNTMVIKMDDFEEAEKRIQEQGSIADRTYGPKAPKDVEPEPITGEVIQKPRVDPKQIVNALDMLQKRIQEQK